MAKRASFEDRSDDEFQESFGYLSTTTPTPTPEDSEEEGDAAIDTDHEEQDNTASTINCDQNCGTICIDDHPAEKHIDDELELIENAFEYLIKKKYPPGCSKNQKRVIRRKAERLEERNGEIFYKKRGGSMVNLHIFCQFLSVCIRLAGTHI